MTKSQHIESSESNNCPRIESSYDCPHLESFNQQDKQDFVDIKAGDLLDRPDRFR